MDRENYCKHYRTKAGLFQYDVAVMMGVSQQFISKLENHPFDVHLRTLLAYAAVLEIPLAVLLPCVVSDTRKPQEAPCQ